ncbi:MAG: hypothetical protein V5A27_01890 [Halapricum sp.]
MSTSKPVRAEDPIRRTGKGDSGTDALVEYGTVCVVSTITIFVEMVIRRTHRRAGRVRPVQYIQGTRVEWGLCDWERITEGDDAFIVTTVSLFRVDRTTASWRVTRARARETCLPACGRTGKSVQ